ncbi:MAG: prephenate dehydrogenase [Kiritimatiellia bacterium]
MTVTIIGLGLIGGSFARDLRDHASIEHIIGVESNRKHADTALEIGIVDDVMPLEKAICSSHAIILATPVDVIRKILPEVLDMIKENQTVIDLGSTKFKLVEHVKDHPMRHRYVAAHPMAGTECSGPSASFKGLFRDKTVLLCDMERSSPDACKTALELFHMAGLKFEFMDAAQHDRHAAYVSHISHIVAYALSLAVQNEEKAGYAVPRLAGGGFASTVRLAMSSPEMWVPILRDNRENILEAVCRVSETLEAFRLALENDDKKKMTDLIRNANRIRDML